MWESRVLCEISKLLWKSFCDFHGSVISTAARFFEFVITSSGSEGGYQPLSSLAIVVPGASYAVMFEPIDFRNRPTAVFACDSSSPSS
jgi:hypothetical protein